MRVRPQSQWPTQTPASLVTAAGPLLPWLPKWGWWLGFWRIKWGNSCESAKLNVWRIDKPLVMLFIIINSGQLSCHLYRQFVPSSLRQKYPFLFRKVLGPSHWPCPVPTPTSLITESFNEVPRSHLLWKIILTFVCTCSISRKSG